jgi:antitoxin component of MazEF toxin-antitoxin module
MRTKLQKTTRGEYFIIIPRDMIKLVGWTEGEEIEVTPGLEVSPRREDLVLRKT